MGLVMRLVDVFPDVIPAYPRWALEEDVGHVSTAVNPFTWIDGNLWPSLLFAMTGAMACGMPNLSACSIACWFLVLAAILRNVEVMFIFDRYMHILLMFSCSLPYQSTDVHTPVVRCSAALLLRLQLAWIYFDAGYGKLVDPTGDWTVQASLPALSVYLHGAPLLGAMVEFDRQHFGGWAIRLLTPAAAWAEMLVGLAALLVCGTSKEWICLRLAPIVTVALLHLGIALGMENGPAIGAIAIAGWIALLPTELWDLLGCGRIAKISNDGSKKDDGTCSKPNGIERSIWARTSIAPAFLSACVAFHMSGYPSSPGPLPTVLLLNRWQVFSGAERVATWDVAPGRLSNGTVVDVWSWRPVDFGLPPRYGRHGRWLSLPFEKDGSENAKSARFRRLCDEWNEAHEVKLEKYQLFELQSVLDDRTMQWLPPTKRFVRAQPCSNIDVDGSK